MSAGIFRRLVAASFDLLLILLLAVTIRVVGPCELLAVALLYQAVFRLRTPGRWLGGVVVVRSDTTSVGTVRSALRTVMVLLSAAPLGAGLLWALFDPQRRALHDRICGTRVVRGPAGQPLRRLRTAGAILGLALLGATGGAPNPSDHAAFPFEDLPLAAVRPIPLANGKIAMSAHMLTGGNQSEAEWRETLRRMRAMGVQVAEIGQIAWHEIEPSPGVYRWGYAKTVLRLNEEEKLGLEFVVDLMFVNPGLDGVARLPEYLEGRAYDDPEVIEALSRLYEACLALPGAGAVRYLFQHFENAAEVVADRPEDVPRLQRLLRESFARARRRRADLRFGVCVQRYEAPHWPRSEIERWNSEIGTDIVPVISFGPSEFEPGNDIAGRRAELEMILEAAGDRPVALHECGCHSHPDAHSSDDLQAAFVRELFQLLVERHDRIEFVTWYEYSDLDPHIAYALGACLSFLAGNPFALGYFSASAGSCGLLTSDGRAKVAARVWVEEARRYYDRRR